MIALSLYGIGYMHGATRDKRRQAENFQFRGYSKEELTHIIHRWKELEEVYRAEINLTDGETR